MPPWFLLVDFSTHAWVQNFSMVRFLQHFANLQSLTIVWASDNELTGNIPDFIGKWSKLTELRLQGNSFEGPISSSFSSLTSLTNLRISDI
ncbi:unnamed protein product, partial [Vitis vinifera]|uniref:LRR receptor-like serine/threonine-protein kinase n=1 Tax=Vitis vinifera TaxID=29760 RepID=D7STB0_VITVI